MCLLRSIHLNNNQNLPKKDETDCDTLYILRSFVNKLQETYKFYYEPHEHQYVDKSMVKFKFKSSTKYPIKIHQTQV